MPRGTVLDLSTVDVYQRIDAVDIDLSPPPAYSQLPATTKAEADPANPAGGHDGGELLDGEGEQSWDEEDDDDDDELDEDSDDFEDERGTGGIDRDLVNDQDWENASGDLTKRYNRLRQHVGALTGEQARQQSGGSRQSPSGSTLQPQQRKVHSATGVPLPASNQSQHQRQSARASSSNANAHVTNAQISGGSANPTNSASHATTGVHASKMESSLAALSQKYAAALNLAPIASTSASTSAAAGNNTYAEPSFTSNAATRKGGSERHNVTKDKADRATVEQVLDPRTRLVLFKMMGRGLLEVVEGCVSTGKEANVYHALGRIHPDTEPPSEQVHLAIKIYKTSILTFKSRSKYLTGEFRFKNGYSKVKNPRKMIRLWAEKEMRNLKRLHAAGILCPEPVEVRGNVLVMTFLGLDADGWEAVPRLKDAELPQERLAGLYIEMVHILRRMFKVCRLVHADLSEYNVLYNPENGRLYTIDVSQSVEGDHPHAFDFLRSDIGNVDEFFSRRGVETLGIRATFGLVVEDGWSKKDGEETLEEIAAEVERRLAERGEEEDEEEQKELAQGQAQEGAEGAVDEFAPPTSTARERQHEADKVFKNAYIPRTLNEVFDAERDVQRVLQGEKDSLIYSQTVGVVHQRGADPDAKAVRPAKSEKKVVQMQGDAEEVEDSESGSHSGSDSGSESGSDDADDDAEGEDDGRVRAPRGKRHEDKDAKRERKNAVKEEKREKRKDKIPKSVKKAKIRKTSGKNRK